MDQVTAGALALEYAPGLTNVLISVDPYAPGAGRFFGELPPNPVLPLGVAGRFDGGGPCTGGRVRRAPAGDRHRLSPKPLT
jgi:hypothetical protein